ncbi:DNA topoisomerase I [Candidatus Woesearchaeota archaeon]|nr:DNA topoisomerase I [Candidatus Woesearchaeota archaeon]
MTTLILAEKPSAAQKIAEALADKGAKKSVYLKKIPYYELTHNGEEIKVVCAVGHLFTVAEKDKKGWKYPVFSMEWKPSYEVSKGAAFTKPYVALIKSACKGVKKIIVATDYDIEGEVIGFNIVRFICGKKDASRMKFSTTTKEDLREAFDKVLNHMDMGQAEAGITRHELDWLFGINLSRALTLSVKNATGMFKILSSGRVQGPALKILATRELDIQKFIPVPYWELALDTKELDALHEHGKFDDRKTVEKIYEKCKGHKAIVKKVDRDRFNQDAPHPFDLTALQVEAYKVLRIQPSETLSLAQVLYTNSYISYPRTSSNQLPESIGYKKIMDKLKAQLPYKAFCEELMKGPLKPNNGKKTDEAHPAIYPTGEIPEDLDERERKLYDLIVKRFLATFAKAAIRETVNIIIDVNKENFLVKGTRTVEENWHKFYHPYVKLQEEEINVDEKQELKVNSLDILDKQTAPPRRYTPASIIKELEKRKLGTKATRSEIIENLFDRNYLKKGDSIEVTGLGLKAIEVLDKYCPDILDEKLTRDFEKDMENIRKGKSNEKETLEHAEKFLTKVLGEFKAKELEIGKELAGSYQETMRLDSFVEKCTCGGDLQIRYTPKFKSYFIACSKYPECKITRSLPRGFLAKGTGGKKCDACDSPEVLLIKKGKRPWVFCINPDCPKKDEYKKKIEKKNNATFEGVDDSKPSAFDQTFTDLP